MSVGVGLETLEQAVTDMDGQLLEYIINQGTNINKIFRDGRAALNTAIATADDVIISLFMAADIDVEIKDSFRVDGARLQPIHYAAIHNQLDLVKIFMERGVSLDNPDEGNCTPLHHATKHGHIDIVLFLVEAGADINWCSNSGRTPLWKAAENGYRDLVQLLYSMGADLNITNKVGETVLFETITRECLLPICRDLVQFGININVKDIEGNTVLHKAALRGKHEACKLVISAGVDVDDINDYGNTALHNAAMQNRLPAMVTLLNHCTCMTSRNRAGQSVLYAAMLHQRVAATRLMYCAGARLSPDEQNKFLLYEANKHDSKRVFWRWCVELFSTPQSLTVICLAAIRNTIINTSKSVNSTVPQLPLPKALHRTLLMEEYGTQ